jgi:hypothetical protein
MASYSNITFEHGNINGKQDDFLVMRGSLSNLCGSMGMRSRSSPNGGTSGVGRRLGTQASLLCQSSPLVVMSTFLGEGHIQQCKVNLDPFFNSTEPCIFLRFFLLLAYFGFTFGSCY